MFSYGNYSDQMCRPATDDRYNRDEREDLKTSLDLFYKFKDEISKLHPNCAYFIDHLVQKPKY